MNSLDVPASPTVSTRIVVQKFGGSSVATEEGRSRAMAKIRQAQAAGCSPVVVVSAMGRHPAPYATDSLLSLLAFADGHVDARERDLLMACGEIISVVVMAHALRQAGIPAVAMTGPQAGVRTDGAHGEALIQSVDASSLVRHVEAGRVPVVAGFQGRGPDGEITTLGRGGSDTSAVALGAALGARSVEIYTDVEGVMTVDPRVYEGARLVPELSYEELGELAVEGAKVMHPRSVDLAGARDVPLAIRSTFGDGAGTWVTSQAAADALEQQRMVTSITPLQPVAQVIVHLAGLDRDEMRSRILEDLAVRSLSLDLINLCQEDLYFIVKQERVKDVTSRLDALGVPFTVRADCAKLSIVGVGMRGMPGVVARIHRTLWRAGVSIIHSTDSNITISCLIASDDTRRAVEALHREFLDAGRA